MIARKMREDFPIVFLGDNHGAWSTLFYEIERRDIRDCFLISVGDCGVGFESKEYTLKLFEMLNRDFKERNIYFKAIRGNHDDPSYFKMGRVHLSHFELLEDYTTIKYKTKTIQFIGGATSIDRIGREKGKSYWSDEKLVFVKDRCQKADILVTHTAPLDCFPRGFNDIVYGWANEDVNLLYDLKSEREAMDKIFQICKPTLHVYGHFHDSYSEEINGCRHRLLGIDEFWEHSHYE